MFSTNLGKAAGIISFFVFLLSGTFVKSKPLLAIAMGTGFAALLWYVGRRKLPVSRVTTTILLAIAASYPFVMYNNEAGAGYYHGGMVLGSLGIAYAFVDERLHRLVAATLVILTVYYFAIFLTSGAAEGIFIGSRNRVSTLFVSLAVFLFALRRGRFDLLLASAVFIACVSASGSSGIISAGLLLLGVLLRTVFEHRGASLPTKLVVTGIGVAAIVAVGTLGPRFLGEEAQQKLRMDRLAGSDVRYQVIQMYAEQHMRGADLIIGAPLQYELVVADDNGDFMSLGNLHNSYLDLHSKTGIFSLVILVTILIRLAQLARRSPYLAVLLVVILVRAFSDTVFILGGNYNFAFYVFFLPLPLLLAGHAATVTPPVQVAGFRPSVITARPDWPRHLHEGR